MENCAVILIIPSASYRTGPFMNAVKKLDLKVLIISDKSQVFSGKYPKNLIVINFKENILDNKMLIISDGSFLNNQFFQGSPLPLGFDKHTNNQYGNNEFILNAIDYLLGNEEFIKIRSKNIAIRLLNKAKVNREKEYWQFFNIIIPIIHFHLD